MFIKMNNSQEQEKIVLKFVNKAIKPGFMYKSIKSKELIVYKSLIDITERNGNYAKIPSHIPWMALCHEVKQSPNQTRIEYLQNFQYKVEVFTKVLCKDDIVGWVDGLTFYIDETSNKLNLVLNNALCTIDEDEYIDFVEKHTKLREITEKSCNE